jgi:hypothetical protein
MNIRSSQRTKAASSSSAGLHLSLTSSAVTPEATDWFPHVSPDGELASYLSFWPGTLARLPDMDVEVRLVRTAKLARRRAALPALRRAGNRQRQQLVPGRSPVRFRGVSDAAVVITMTKPGVIAISMQGAKQWTDSGA